MPGENKNTNYLSNDQASKSSSFRSTSAINSNKRHNVWTHRPKSTPVFSRHPFMASTSSQNVFRPDTAQAVRSHLECDRVRQLEHEPTRCQKFQNHLSIRKSKLSHWQKNLEAPLVDLHVGNGYYLSRSKTRNYVTLKDEFFEPRMQESYNAQQMRKPSPTTTPVKDKLCQPSEFKKKMESIPERDDLVAQLQQQISDLTMYLEEERLSHKETKLKAEEFLKDKTDQINAQFQDVIRDMKAEHENELLKQKQTMEVQQKEAQDTMENQIRRMAKEIELLQSAFESYKGTLHLETTQKWSTREEEQRQKLAEEMQQTIHEIKTKLIQEKNQERANLVKEHHKAINSLRKENKREMDSLIRRFSNAATDIDKLKETTAELEETKSGLEKLKERYNTTSQQLTNAANQLTDAKVRLVEFEERFEEKASQVEDRYIYKLQELMTQNTELKRLYVQKCRELFDEKTNSNYKTTERVRSAKETLERMVKTSQQTNVSNLIEESVKEITRQQADPGNTLGGAVQKKKI